MKTILALFVLAWLLPAQTRNSNTNVVHLGSVDSSGAVSTKPLRVVSSDPSGACTVINEIVAVSSGKLFQCVAGVWAQVGGAGSFAGTWGSITGALNTQVDLQSALDLKQPLDPDLAAIAGITRTRGGLIVGGASAWQSLGIGAATRVLKSDGTDAAWGQVALSELSMSLAGTRCLQSSADGLSIVVAAAECGTGIANAFVSMTDGTTTAASSGSDTFKFRSASNLLSVAVGSNDVTHGDNLLLTINQGNFALSSMGGAVTDAQVPDTIALSNLTQITTRAYSDLQGIPSTFAPSAHAANHQHGGSDQVATATPGANAIPKAGAGGTLGAGWLPDLSGTYQPLDADLTAIGAISGVRGDVITRGASGWQRTAVGVLNRVLKSDGTDPAWGQVSYLELTSVPASFTPSSHASSHQDDGADEIATETPGAGAIPKADAMGILASGWLPIVPASKGGLGANASAFSGVLKIAAGVASVVTGSAPDCVKVDGSSGSCGSGGGAGAGSYTQSFTAQTSVTLSHGLGSKNIIAACRDGSDNFIDWNTFVATSTSAATVTFSTAQTGYCTVTIGGGGVRYGTTFSSQTTVTIAGTSHNLGASDIHVQCRDSASPRQIVEPNTVTIDDTSFDVVITFSVAQSGRCSLI